MKLTMHDAKSKMDRSDLHKEIAGVRTEMMGISRWLWIIIGGLITTKMSFFCVNWYFN